VIDDDLRDRMRHTDPAASLPPLSRDELTRVLEKAMTATTTVTRPADHRPSPGRRRLALVAAALMLATAGALGHVLTTDRPRPAPGPTVAGKPPAAAAPLALAVGAGPTAKCAWPPNPRFLRGSDIAFAGTVVRVTDGAVSIRVTHVFTGPAVTDVTLRQTKDSESITFRAGTGYLIAASGGTVDDCLSGVADPDRQHAYDAAFRGR
jgi:hypothetical protein